MRFSACAALLAIAATAFAGERPPPHSIDELRSRNVVSTITYERALEDGPGFSAYLVSYLSDGLKLYALVAVPGSTPPKTGFPVLVANHGNHPNPPSYGFTADGVDSRPGDYYRSIPQLFTSHGFMVVMPDYRGHNISEGLEFAHGFLASAYYSADVLALLSAVPGLEHADADNIFMWGHSLGGEVTLRALLATNNVKGASLWSAVGGDIWDQAFYYSRYEHRDATDGSDVAKTYVDQLKSELDAYSGKYDWRSVEPLRFLQYLRTPLILHHSIGDYGALYEWSERLAKELYLLGQPYRFYSYPGTDHFYQGDVLQKAVTQDVEFFESLMNGEQLK